MPAAPTHAALAQALLEAVRAQPWHAARDRRRNGAPFTHPPSLDLAVAWFMPGQAAVFANVLFSRELQDGLAARIDDDAGAVGNIAYQADIVDAQGTSIAWQPHSDWSGLRFPALAGNGPRRFVSPYPASLVKLMVAVGVAYLVDWYLADWDEPWLHAGRRQAVARWAEPMLTESSNQATDAMVALLHARGLIGRVVDGTVAGASGTGVASASGTGVASASGGQAAAASGRESRNELHALFARQGLTTLRLANTRADGGWRNGDGAGVGQLQMTAWDTLRLLWRLQDDRAPWLSAAAPPMLSAPSRRRLMAWLAAQRLNEVLSSGSLAHVPGWQPGIAGRFAHKTGSTESYAADAGRVELPGGGHFLIALLTSLGQASAPHPDCATDWSVPRLGAAVERWLLKRLA